MKVTVKEMAERFRVHELAMQEAGQQIDPATAEVIMSYEQTLDPYGMHPDLPEEYQQFGREYFACSPGSDVWVAFRDLPRKTAEDLKEKRRASDEL